MAQLIATDIHSGTIKKTYVEDGKAYETMEFNFDKFIDDTQRSYNESIQAGSYSKDGRTYVEEMRIPEALYWHIREKALANGRTHTREINEYVLATLRNGDYSKFYTDIAAKKFKQRKFGV